MIYPAEFEDEIARWLLDASYNGRRYRRGWPQPRHQLLQLERERAATRADLEQTQHSTPHPAEVFANVHEPVQR
jgi:hypothetical protein